MAIVPSLGFLMAPLPPEILPRLPVSILGFGAGLQEGMGRKKSESRLDICGCLCLSGPLPASGPQGFPAPPCGALRWRSQCRFIEHDRPRQGSSIRTHEDVQEVGREWGPGGLRSTEMRKRGTILSWAGEERPPTASGNLVPTLSSPGDPGSPSPAACTQPTDRSKSH